MRKLLIISLFLFVVDVSSAASLEIKQFQKGTPPRIIRTCCAFGNDVKYVAIPFLKHSDLISFDGIGNHTYLGDGDEGNGIIYTRKGGFLDLGHLRDQADWTAYLQKLILQNKGNNNFMLVLGREAGKKELHLKIPVNLSEKDAALLAGRIAYDLSVWHEIATWYGASTVPMVPERYSSFSAEDDYSNRLGIILSIDALMSDEPYDEAMSRLLHRKLMELRVVETYEETLSAMEMVDGEWWSSEYRLPSKKILLNHQVSNYNTAFPLLISNYENADYIASPIDIVQFDSGANSLNDFYSLNFTLNGKVPFRKLFKERKKKRLISSVDFPFILDKIEKEVSIIKYRKLRRKRKERKKKDSEILHLR